MELVNIISFLDWETGIRGAAQHLAIYAGVPLIEPIDDPRANRGEYFGIVQRRVWGHC